MSAFTKSVNNLNYILTNVVIARLNVLLQKIIIHIIEGCVSLFLGVFGEQ